MNRINIISDGLYKAIIIGYKYCRLYLCRQNFFQISPKYCLRVLAMKTWPGDLSHLETEELKKKKKKNQQQQQWEYVKRGKYKVNEPQVDVISLQNIKILILSFVYSDLFLLWSIW